MKKIFFFTLIVMAIEASPFAQDTLHLAGPKNNYFCNNWLDSASFCRWEHRNGYMYPGDAVAKFFQTKNPIRVYGIAAILLNPWDDFNGDTVSFIGTYIDTCRCHCSSSLRLYQYDSSVAESMVPLGDSLPVFATDDASYYLDMGMSGPSPMSSSDNDDGGRFPLYPVFERFFPTPQTVNNIFYTGICFHQDWTVNDFGWSTTVQYSQLPFYLPLFVSNDTNDWIENNAMHYIEKDPMTNDIDTTWIFTWNRPGYMFIFPILTPAPDTTVNPTDTAVNPGDSLAIRPNDLIYRYTNVAPNPARNSVRITSSFGISRIEAYDLRGRRIYESPQLSTFSFPLSTIDWPRGTYLLRITTPAGTTTKKLLIQ